MKSNCTLQTRLRAAGVASMASCCSITKKGKHAPTSAGAALGMDLLNHCVVCCLGVGVGKRDWREGWVTGAGLVPLNAELAETPGPKGLPGGAWFSLSASGERTTTM